MVEEKERIPMQYAFLHQQSEIEILKLCRPGGHDEEALRSVRSCSLNAGIMCTPGFRAGCSGTVKGVCKDIEGNPIADGVVVFVNQDNGQKYTLKTNKKGEYFSLGVGSGTYNVIAL